MYSDALFTTTYQAYNGRNRVAGVLYFNEYTVSTTDQDFEHALVYNYDVHGNVKELVNYFSSLKDGDCTDTVEVGEVTYTNDCEAHIKRVVYNLSLIHI